MQSNVMAGCNECFPVGWTVTLWMAGDSRPEGERIRDSPAFFEFRLILTNKTHASFMLVFRPIIIFFFDSHSVLCVYIPLAFPSICFRQVSD